jgi:hypothetical protein
MAVSLIVSAAKAATPTDIADTLAGGGTGIDFGQVVNGQYAPLIDQTLNQGAKTVFLSHNATFDPITNLKLYIDSYAATGFTYGGAVNAALDYNAIKAQGAASSSSKNNADGNSGGIWMEMQRDVTETNQFDASRVSGANHVRIFNKAPSGSAFDALLLGVTEGGAFTIGSASMLYSPDNSAENAPSAAVNGQLGKSTDSVLGNYSKLRFRSYLRDDFPDGGIFQWAFVFTFSFTA